MAASRWARHRWKLLPLTPEDWEKLSSFFRFGSYGYETIQTLRRINNAKLQVDWMYGGAEGKIGSMNRKLKREDAPYKMVNSYGPGARATRKYYVQIYSLAEKKTNKLPSDVAVLPDQEPAKETQLNPTSKPEATQRGFMSRFLSNLL